jgi:hypothetical protein
LISPPSFYFSPPPFCVGNKQRTQVSAAAAAADMYDDACVERDVSDAFQKGLSTAMSRAEGAKELPLCRSKAFRAYASSLLRAESASNSHLSLLFVSTRAAHSTTELSRPVTFLLSSLSAHRARIQK